MTRLILSLPPLSLATPERGCTLQGLFTALLLCIITAVAQAQHPPDDSRGWVAHDPVMIKQDSLYYLFVTGGGVATSPDLKN